MKNYNDELKRVSVRKNDFFELVFYALRYVLPRKDYVINDVGNLIAYYKVHITDSDKEILRKEIKKSMLERPMRDGEKEYWQQFLERF